MAQLDIVHFVVIMSEVVGIFILIYIINNILILSNIYMFIRIRKRYMIEYRYYKVILRECNMLVYKKEF
jgi:hypothetical protein